MDPATLHQFARYVETHGAVMLQGIPVPRDRFGTPDGLPHTDLIIAQAAGGGYAALVPEALTPRTNGLEPHFANTTVAEGWRILAIGKAASVEEMIRRAGDVLGSPELIAYSGSPDEQAKVTDLDREDGRVRVPVGSSHLRSDGAASDGLPFTQNLTAAARAGRLDVVYGRDNELDQVITVLMQKSQNCPILIGEPGVGKTAVAHKLAAASALPNGLPKQLSGLEVLCLDTAGLLAQSGTAGALEGNLGRLFDALTGSCGVLFVDEFHALASVRGSGPTAYDLMKPRLTDGVRVLAATTQKEYQLHVASDEALARRFCPVVVDEPSQEETERILGARLPALMAHHQVAVDGSTLSEIVRLADEYFRGGYRPHKALALLDRAMATEALQADRSIP